MPEASTGKGPEGAHGPERILEGKRVNAVRFFGADRPNLPTTDINLSKGTDKTSPGPVSIEDKYNLALGSSSMDERRKFWVDNGNPTYEVALNQWRDRLVSVVNKVEDTDRIAAIRSILPDDHALKDKDKLLRIDQDDATRLFNEYSNNESNIDKFMKHAITNLTQDGQMDAFNLQIHINHIRWLATGFFGKDTATRIGTEIQYQVDASQQPPEPVRTVVAPPPEPLPAPVRAGAVEQTLPSKNDDGNPLLAAPVRDAGTVRTAPEAPATPPSTEKAQASGSQSAGAAPEPVTQAAQPEDLSKLPIEELQAKLDLLQTERQKLSDAPGDTPPWLKALATLNAEIDALNLEIEKKSSIEIRAKSVANEQHSDRNEDALFQILKKQAFGVFDGMGGHAAGDVASRIARDYVERSLRELPDGLSLDQTQLSLVSILNKAHEKISQQASENSELNGMGTTASVVKIWDGPQDERKAVIGNVGDSRVYVRHADGSLEQVTLDDNAITKMMARQTISLTEARALQSKLSNVSDLSTLTQQERELFKNRNSIAQALGHHTTPRIHVVDVRVGDRIIVTSDGIHDNLTDTEISKILAQSPDNQKAVENLTEAARRRSQDITHPRHKPDDMSAVIAEISPTPATTPRPRVEIIRPEDTPPPDATPNPPTAKMVEGTARVLPLNKDASPSGATPQPDHAPNGKPATEAQPEDLTKLPIEELEGKLFDSLTASKKLYDDIESKFSEAKNQTRQLSAPNF